MDSDSDGMLSLDEVLTGVSDPEADLPVAPGFDSTYDEFTAKFKHADVDASGLLDNEEFSASCAEFAEDQGHGHN